MNTITLSFRPRLRGTNLKPDNTADNSLENDFNLFPSPITGN